MKSVVIVQSNYIPWKGYFDLINLADELILYDDVQYTKGDWRNRNRIKTRKGSMWLTIPVENKGGHRQKIEDIQIADPKWSTRHWKVIIYNYAKARYFADCKEFFEELYLGNAERMLSRINHRFISAICGILGIQAKILWSTDYQSTGNKSERLLNLCKQAGATEYISGPTAQSYLDVSMFNRERIKVSWMSYDNYLEYNQIYCPPFVHEVSILDLLMNEGAEGTKRHMQSWNMCRGKILSEDLHTSREFVE